jgi:hypothetical protein
MARIELRHAVVRLKDGFSGTAKVNQAMTPPANGDTSMTIDNVVTNDVLGTDRVPIGARFTTTDETGITYTVTGRTPTNGSAVTTAITFTPALTTSPGLPDDNDDITFLPQEIEVTMGDGNLTFSEKKTYDYQLDRGDLDTVRETDQVPMDVTLDGVWEFLRTGTSETITPYDALRGRGGAVEWTTSSDDACEPFAVDLEVEYTPPCGSGGTQIETYLFPDFRPDSIDGDIKAATISAKGRCNATEPTITRTDP